LYLEGKDNFYDDSSEKSIKKAKDLKEKIKKEIDDSNNEIFIKHYKNKDKGIPIWVAVEVLSFGTVSTMYANWKNKKVMRKVINSFEIFGSYTKSVPIIHSISLLRNLCAHHARIWNRQLRVQPLSPKKTAHTWISSQHVTNNRLFYALSMIIYLLNTVNPNHTFKQKLENLFNKYPNVDKAAMGFPENRQTEPLWK